MKRLEKSSIFLTQMNKLFIVVYFFSNNIFRSTGDGSEHLFASRYELDFKEIGYIAAGGFGVVYKAQNILDNTEYAIKKIIIGY